MNYAGNFRLDILPAFLPAHDLGDGRVYLDGGVWANNPVLVGVLEAIVNVEKRPDEIDVLNIGTTEEPFHLPDILLREEARGGGGRRSRHCSCKLRPMES